MGSSRFLKNPVPQTCPKLDEYQFYGTSELTNSNNVFYFSARYKVMLICTAVLIYNSIFLLYFFKVMEPLWIIFELLLIYLIYPLSCCRGPFNLIIKIFKELLLVTVPYVPITYNYFFKCQSLFWLISLLGNRWINGKPKMAPFLWLYLALNRCELSDIC